MKPLSLLFPAIFFCAFVLLCFCASAHLALVSHVSKGSSALLNLLDSFIASPLSQVNTIQLMTPQLKTIQHTPTQHTSTYLPSQTTCSYTPSPFNEIVHSPYDAVVFSIDTFYQYMRLYHIPSSHSL